MSEQQTLKNQTAARFQVREVGTIKSVRECIIRVKGLPSCIIGQIVELKQGGKGLIMGFNEEDVQVLVIDTKTPVGTGDEVFSKGEFLHFPAGEAFLGRVVNSLCEPLDDKGPIEPADYYPVFAEAAGVMDRVPVRETLETGTLVIDAVIPIARGQRQLLIGDRLTGKTTVAIDAIINQKGKDVLCIYCCIGKPYSALLKVLNIFRQYDVMPYTIVVAGVASASLGEQYLAPYTAAMLGDYLMHNGKDVVVVFDDLTRHAWIYRQISLLLERPPGREAYPGDIFYIHSQLMERAGHLKPELGGGSMTFFPIVEILQGDVTGYISSNLISMTDGQIYFNSALFNKGIKPAIDFGLSVSRIGNRAQWAAMRALSEQLKIEYIQYQELIQMTQLRATGLSREAEERMKRGQATTQILIQDKNRPLSIEAQVIYLFALSIGVLDSISISDIKKFKDTFMGMITNWYPDLFVELRNSKVLTDSSIEKLYDAVGRYFQGV